MFVNRPKFILKLPLLKFVHCKIVKVFLINVQLHAFKCNKLTPLTKHLPLLLLLKFPLN
jgi:hypothetical protein